MSRCASHGELVGGYVLGALAVAEMEDMSRHVQTCPACGPETRRLARLPALLDEVEPDDVPPPMPPPAVEEAVLDRFARERLRATREPRRWPRRVAAAAAVCVAALALVLAVDQLGEDGEGGGGSYATAKLTALDSGSSARATAYADAVPAGTSVSLWARGLTPPSGAVYELWCVRANGEWVSGGTFRASRDGRAAADLTAAVKPGDYHVMVVTRRAQGAAEGSRGEPILRGRLRY